MSPMMPWASMALCGSFFKSTIVTKLQIKAHAAILEQGAAHPVLNPGAQSAD
jgi:uncharacterized membrane protein